MAHDSSGEVGGGVSPPSSTHSVLRYDSRSFAPQSGYIYYRDYASATTVTGYVLVLATTT
jgi:hypothetical protein